MQDLDGGADAAPPDLIAAAAVGIVSVDADARILSANAAAVAMLGRAEKDLVGLGAHEALNGSRPADGCELEQAVRDGSALHVEEDAFRNAAGSPLPVWWAVNPLRSNPDGRLLGAVLVFGDTTSRRQQAAAQALESARGRADLAEAQGTIADLEWAAATSQAISSTLDEREVMDRLTRLAAGRFAEFAFASLIADAVAVRASHAAGDGVDIDLDELVSRPEFGLDAGVGSATYRLMTSPELTEFGPAELADGDLLGARTRGLLQAIGAARILVVPLVARGQVVGTLTLVRTDDRPFSEVDRLAATDVCLRGALAVDHARLFRAQSDIATRLQHALLPQLPVMALRAAVRYLPARDRFDVGGDWYDAFRLPDDTIALVVGDVAGHDLAAGTTMSALRNLLRGVNVVTDGSPGEVLQAVDESLDALTIDGTATVLLAHVRAHGDDAWSIRWSNAGHMPPLLLSPEGRVEMLTEVHGTLLGTGFSQQRAVSERIVPAGTTIVLYTDGLVETREETIDEGLIRLRRSATALTARIDDPESIADELLARNHASVEDDTALLVCHLP